MIITLSGTAGSGKSTIAVILAEKLQGERLYVGGLRRELARQKGMTLQELNEYAKVHPETDVDVDLAVAENARQLEKKHQWVIVEGRTQFHFLPESIKVFVTVDIEEAARRIWNDLQNSALQQQRNEGKISSVEEMKRDLIRRNEDDAHRYIQYYGFDHRDVAQYDLVVDTTRITPAQAVGIILRFVHEKQNLNSTISNKAYK